MLRPKSRGDSATGKLKSPTLVPVAAIADALGVELWELFFDGSEDERQLRRRVFAAVGQPAIPQHPVPAPAAPRPMRMVSGIAAADLRKTKTKR